MLYGAEKEQDDGLGWSDSFQLGLVARETCWIWFGSILVTTSHVDYSHSAARTGLDHSSQIWFPACNSVPFFQRPGSYGAKPTRIQSGRPGQVLAKWIWSGSKLVSKHRRAHFLQTATGPLSVSHFQTVLAQMSLIKLCKTSPDLIWSRDKLGWTRIIQPASSQHFSATRIWSSMFTGYLHLGF